MSEHSTDDALDSSGEVDRYEHKHLRIKCTVNISENTDITA